MTTAVGWKARIRLSDAIVAVVWLVVVDLLAGPPAMRWIKGDPPQARMDPDEIGVAQFVPHRAIPIRLLDGGGSDHAILFVPVAIAMVLTSVGAVLVALFARCLAAGELSSGRAERLAWWLGGLLCVAALGLPVIRGIVEDQAGGFGFIYEPDVRLLVAGVLVGACALALRRENVLRTLA